MSDRIEELRQNSWQLGPDDADELFAHIDHLTAQLAERDKQIETLRAACRDTVRIWNETGEAIVQIERGKSDADIDRVRTLGFARVVDVAVSALAATEPKGT